MVKDTVEKIPESDIHIVKRCSGADIDNRFKALDKAVKAYKKSFIDIALNLCWIDDACSCIGARTERIYGVFYKNIAEFAFDMYGISKATTYQYIAIAKKFGKINPETGFIDKLDDKYKDYGSTALIIMSGMTDEQLAKCNPDMKIKELQAIRSGLSLEDKSKDPKKPGPKKDKPKQSSNSANLYTIKNIEDFETHAKEIMESIKKALMQNNGTEYQIEISMVWD